MKQFYLIFLFSLFCSYLPAQYFFTGEVKDLHGDKLQNGSILVRSTGAMYNPGSYGEFGINSRLAEDSLVLSYDGYEPFTTVVRANEYLRVTLKKPSLPGNSQNGHIKCVYQGALGENAFVGRSGPISFAGNMDRASYGIVERFLGMGYSVPTEAVQIEELLNHFNFYHSNAENADVFNCSSTVMACPWNTSNRLLCLNICAGKKELQNSPPTNLVLLIDVSGSMDLPDKLPIIKSGIRLLADNLRDVDHVSIIAFGGRVRTLLEGIPGTKKGKIIKAIEELSPDGSTPGEDGIKMAYEVARRQFIEGGNNRIVLVTDGDISEDPSREQALEDFVASQRGEGISLHAIGVGMGDNRDSHLAVLAQKGLGGFDYANDEEDAERLLAGQLTKTSLAVADAVSITTLFDTSLVAGFRLIGYDNKKCLTEDTAFRLEGGKICSGHSMLALFEFIPRIDTTGKDTLATVQINYCMPGKPAVKNLMYYCPIALTPFDKAQNGLRRAICIAMLGIKLRNNADAAEISWPDIERMTKKNFPGNDWSDKEMMDLIAKAKKVYAVRN